MHWKRIKLSQQNLMNYTLQNVATTAALTLYAFISFLPEARSACVLTSGTWECSGSITARILNQSVQSAGPAGHGIYIGTGNLSIHVPFSKVALRLLIQPETTLPDFQQACPGPNKN